MYSLSLAKEPIAEAPKLAKPFQPSLLITFQQQHDFVLIEGEVSVLTCALVSMFSVFSRRSKSRKATQISQAYVPYSSLVIDGDRRDSGRICCMEADLRAKMFSKETRCCIEAVLVLRKVLGRFTPDTERLRLVPRQTGSNKEEGGADVMRFPVPGMYRRYYSRDQSTETPRTMDPSDQLSP